MLWIASVLFAASAPPSPDALIASIALLPMSLNILFVNSMSALQNACFFLIP